ncbi:MAG: tRNA uridine-5-carboxymethylaminomethyl(34) synthesis GTPase MnmE [Halioglobus sp.]|nr:tRNA uridine-5-carboxymethylaminomethyl(34) synthesis GTPase MnmE [Halioglobus sp.]
MQTDSIAAIATAPGKGGIGIIRVSGANARAIGEHITGTTLTPRYAHYGTFRTAGGTELDSGIALYFPGPASFTGEDVVELQAHGGPVILDLLLREILSMGARQAEPGEFSQRAFLNNKIDLTQAEAIADLINASTEQSAQSAARSLKGDFAHAIDALVAQVTQLRVYVEAAIDFPEEEIDFLADSNISSQLDTILEHFARIRSAAEQGSLLREGMKLVIAGKPNAGKSSLLNALSGQDTAIVTAIAGTTRDVLREHIQIDGLPLHLIDTAGLRDSADPIEREGMRRALEEAASADRVLLVVDSSNLGTALPDPAALWREHAMLDVADLPVTIVLNKSDLAGEEPVVTTAGTTSFVRLSAKTGAGLPLLREHLKASMGYEQDSGHSFSARRRHLEALADAQALVLSGREQLRAAAAGELLAEDLRQCQNRLGEITGTVTSDDLLGEIFSSFCIGK